MPGLVVYPHGDPTTVPLALRTAVALLGHPHETDCPAGCERHLPALAVDAEEAMYVLSVLRIEAGQEPVMPRWQKVLVRLLEKGSANRPQVLHLPPARTVVMGAETML